MGRGLGLGTLFLLALSAEGAVPPDGAPAPGEDPGKDPLEVCWAMVQAARDGNLDGIVARTSEHARKRFGWLPRLALSLGRRRIAHARCIDMTLDAEGNAAQVTVWSPETKRVQVPFVRERGFWRLDHLRWEEHRNGKAVPGR